MHNDRFVASRSGSLMRGIALATGLAFAAAGVTAQAAVVNWEDIAVGVGVNSIGGDRVSGGFNFDSTANHTHLVHDTSGVDAFNGTTTLQSDDNNGASALIMTVVGGGTFSLNKLDIGEGFAWATQGATVVRVTGVPSAGPALVMDITIDGIFDAGGPGNDFQTILFGAGWTNLVSVSFDGFAGPSIRVFLLDNIEVNAVPLPATPLLLALGLCAFGMVRGRGNSQS